MTKAQRVAGEIVEMRKSYQQWEVELERFEISLDRDFPTLGSKKRRDRIDDWKREHPVAVPNAKTIAAKLEAEYGPVEEAARKVTQSACVLMETDRLGNRYETTYARVDKGTVQNLANVLPDGDGTGTIKERGE